MPMNPLFPKRPSRKRRRRLLGPLLTAVLFVLGLRLLMLSRHEPAGQGTIEDQPSALDSQASIFPLGLDGSIDGIDGSGSSDMGVAIKQGPSLRSMSFNTSAPLFLTFSTAPFRDLLFNWVLSMQALPGPPQQLLIGAMDAATAAECEAQGWRYITLQPSDGGEWGLGWGLPSRDVELRRQQQASGDREAAAAEVAVVAELIGEGIGMETVVVSHPDTAWQRDPSGYLAQHPAADMFIATGCLSHEADEAWAPNHGQPLCGHITGNGNQSRAFSTGVYVVRKRAAVVELLARWKERLQGDQTAAVQLLPPFNETQPRGAAQQALRWLLEENHNGLPLTPAAEPRTVLARGGTLALHPLPVLLFPVGHMAFVQRLPFSKGAQPYVVHANADRWYGHEFAQPEEEAAAKRGRLREAGLWRADSADYYAVRGGRYLAYTNDVVAFVEGLAEGAEKKGGSMPPFHRHMAGMAYQQALFRDALAAASMLRRTLVLPPSWCWCDLNWDVEVLKECTIRGTGMQLPFRCPTDHAFHPAALEQEWVVYRMPGFLENPQVPEAVRRDVVELQMASEQPLAAEGAAPEGQLWPGMTQAELVAAAAHAANASVLAISMMRPGLLRGFTSESESFDFDVMHAKLTKGLAWYCGSWREGGEWEEVLAYWYYDQPQPYTEDDTAWQAPQMAAPQWCDLVPGPLNRQVVAWPSHPCTFLRNTASMPHRFVGTVAAAAAAEAGA